MVHMKLMTSFYGLTLFTYRASALKLQSKILQTYGRFSGSFWLWDHDPIQRQMFNELSYPGTPGFKFLR